MERKYTTPEALEPRCTAAPAESVNPPARMDEAALTPTRKQRIRHGLERTPEPTDASLSAEGRSAGGLVPPWPATSSGWEHRRMRRVLLTGSSGGVGRAVTPVLKAAGWSVQQFDLAEGRDVRDFETVLRGAQECDEVVHAGALAHDSAGSAAEIVATNLLGTWHVLLAAEMVGVSRVVYFSSAQVFGFAEGEGEPCYLPVDDDHPIGASRPYGMSKRLAEEMCAAWTQRTGIPTVVLRPVMILDERGLQSMSAENAELGAYVHVTDVARATLLSLSIEVTGHHRVTLCGPGPFDTTAAADLLGWTATRGWPDTRRPADASPADRHGSLKGGAGAWDGTRRSRG